MNRGIATDPHTPIGHRLLTPEKCIVSFSIYVFCRRALIEIHELITDFRGDAFARRDHNIIEGFVGFDIDAGSMKREKKSEHDYFV